MEILNNGTFFFFVRRLPVMDVFVTEQSLCFDVFYFLHMRVFILDEPCLSSIKDGLSGHKLGSCLRSFGTDGQRATQRHTESSR